MNNNIVIDRTKLQIIAFSTMIIDHIGAFIVGTYRVEYPDNSLIAFLYIALRAIGRIAFPLFAFMISQGVCYSRNRLKYFLRLVLVGLISIIPYSLLLNEYNDKNTIFSNVMFLLAIGVAMLSGIIYLEEYLKEKGKKRIVAIRILQGVIVLGAAVLASAIGTDYGAYGVILILLFYLCRRRINLIFPVCGLWMLAYCFYKPVLYYIYYALIDTDAENKTVILEYTMSWAEISMFAIFSLFIIYFYDGRRGHSIPQWISYLIYPIQFIVIYLVKMLL